MSSPRGVDAGGMGAIGTGIASEVFGSVFEALSGGEGDAERTAKGGGRGKKKEKGLKMNLKRRGGLRRFRYMLKDRRALFACGTYLAVYQ
jgi:hypothetical protein